MLINSLFSAIVTDQKVNANDNVMTPIRVQEITLNIKKLRKEAMLI